MAPKQPTNGSEDDEAVFWTGVRNALLQIIANIEAHKLHTAPTTHELRQAYVRWVHRGREGTFCEQVRTGVE